MAPNNGNECKTSMRGINSWLSTYNTFPLYLMGPGTYELVLMVCIEILKNLISDENPKNSAWSCSPKWALWALKRKWFSWNIVEHIRSRQWRGLVKVELLLVLFVGNLFDWPKTVWKDWWILLNRWTSIEVSGNWLVREPFISKEQFSS